MAAVELLIKKELKWERYSHQDLSAKVDELNNLGRKEYEAKVKEHKAENDQKKAEERKAFFDTAEKVASYVTSLACIGSGIFLLSNGAIVPGISLLVSGTASLANSLGITSWVAQHISSNPTVENVAAIALTVLSIGGAALGGAMNLNFVNGAITVLQGGLAIVSSYANYKVNMAKADTEEVKLEVEVAETDFETVNTSLSDQLKIDTERYSIAAESVHTYLEAMEIFN